MQQSDGIQPSERLQGSDARVSDAVGDEGRVTLTHIVDKIQHTSFFRVGETGVDPDGIMTICVLTMKNGFIITGQSACVSAEIFNKEIGEQVAYDNAIDTVWKLEGYLLREKLYQLAKAQRERDDVVEVTDEDLFADAPFGLDADVNEAGM